jgi:hypothetical protein
MLYTEIKDCRLCRGTRLTTVLDLGVQALTGVFPKPSEPDAPAGPLQLCKCDDCDLVQLKHNYNLSQMYGDNYGYRSGLNQSMVKHLHQKVAKIRTLAKLNPGDLVVDIGSNDSTTLQAYPENLTLVGVDPSGPKFKQYYPTHISLIPDFFSAKLIKAAYPGKRAKVITSIAMFYDLERPQLFVNEIAELLDEDGLWVFEQSYLPFMLDTHSYDTACHEHLEYYSLKQIKLMLDRARLKIMDIEFNDINGGSFSVTAAKKGAPNPEATALIEQTLGNENRMGLGELELYRRFAEKIVSHRQHLLDLLVHLKGEGKKVVGYGASTKGNVLIQYCGLDAKLVPYIAEINPDKFGARTPGSNITIISETEARAMKPDYFLVFPWHFKSAILQREQAFIRDGGQFIFPLPSIEIVSSAGSKFIWPVNSLPGHL